MSLVVSVGRNVPVDLSTPNATRVGMENGEWTGYQSSVGVVGHGAHGSGKKREW